VGGLYKGTTECAEEHRLKSSNGLYGVMRRAEARPANPSEAVLGRTGIVFLLFGAFSVLGGCFVLTQ
jgi:hypothetical protein